MARVIEGERGGKLLIYQGYKYARNRTRGLAIYWRCSRQGCSTALISNVFDLEGLAAHIIVRHAGEHRHLPEDDSIEVQEVVNHVKAVIRNTGPEKRVYDTVIGQYLQQGAGIGAAPLPIVPTFESVRSSLNRTRSRIVPPVPQNMDDMVNIAGEWANTWNDEMYSYFVSFSGGALIRLITVFVISGLQHTQNIVKQPY